MLHGELHGESHTMQHNASATPITSLLQLLLIAGPCTEIKGGEGASAPASSNKQGMHAKCPLSDFSPCPSKTICTICTKTKSKT